MIALPKIISSVFIIAGIFVLLQVIVPVASFQIWQLRDQFDSESSLASPQRSGDKSVLGVSIENRDNFPAFISENKRETPPPYTRFRLTVPKMKLEESTVEVDSNDLTKGLVHLPGSALPGERGNIFVSGHSALPTPFSFKKAPFSNLTDLKLGDEIIIEAEGTKFTYQVVSIKAVDPKDTSVINPLDKLGRYISLMTCVPPGLNFKRLIVLGKML